MQTKLTLRLDAQLIAQAKKYAQSRGKSVSQMVAEYFVLLGQEETTKPLPPVTRSLRGALRGADVDEGDYRRHLEEKHQ